MEAVSAFEPRVGGPEEAEFDRSLRPTQLSEFLGQTGVIDPLEVMIRAAHERGECVEHLLFSGLPGLGKTSLAMALAAHMGKPMKVTSGPALDRAKDLVGILSNLERGTVLFVDEIHRMPRVVEEYLYGAMERFQLEFTLDQGVHARLLKLDVPPFTLVGATTREGLLTGALRSRFGHILRFEPYDTDSLARIVTQSAQRLGIHADDEAVATLAVHARGVPRLANRLLRRARDVAQVEGNGSIDAPTIERTFRLLGIDEHGLERTDRRLLEALADARGGPLGLKALATAVEEPEDTLEDVFEPWLIRQGWMTRTPQGRMLLDAGFALLGRPPEPPATPRAEASAQ